MDFIIGTLGIAGFIFILFVFALIGLIPLYFIVKWAIKKAIVESLDSPMVVNKMISILVKAQDRDFDMRMKKQAKNSFELED